MSGHLLFIHGIDSALSIWVLVKPIPREKLDVILLFGPIPDVFRLSFCADLLVGAGISNSEKAKIEV